MAGRPASNPLVRDAAARADPAARSLAREARRRTGQLGCVAIRRLGSGTKRARITLQAEGRLRYLRLWVRVSVIGWL